MRLLSPSQSVHGRAARKRNRNENGTRSPLVVSALAATSDIGLAV
jgi:hypothetical protein